MGGQSMPHTGWPLQTLLGGSCVGLAMLQAGCGASCTCEPPARTGFGRSAWAEKGDCASVTGVGMLAPLSHGARLHMRTMNPGRLRRAGASQLPSAGTVCPPARALSCRVTAGYQHGCPQHGTDRHTANCPALYSRAAKCLQRAKRPGVAPHCPWLCSCRAHTGDGWYPKFQGCFKSHLKQQARSPCPQHSAAGPWGTRPEEDAGSMPRAVSVPAAFPRPGRRWRFSRLASACQLEYKGIIFL